jgi:DNA-binding response OmpR family regulator
VPKILLVSDDRVLVGLLARALRRAGLDPLAAYDAPTAEQVFGDKHPDLVVLDAHLGATGGLEVLESLRARGTVPVIMLTEVRVRGLGLMLGADDSLTKPFSHRALIARVQARLRRAGRRPPARPAPRSRLEVAPIVLDVATRSVFKRGQPVSLTVAEFRLLHALMRHAGTTVPTEALFEQVWGYHSLDGGTDLVRATVHRLQRKLEDDPGQPTLLHTILGVGVLLRRGHGA